MLFIAVTLLMMQLQSFSLLFLVLSVVPMGLIGVVAALLLALPARPGANAGTPGVTPRPRRPYAALPPPVLTHYSSQPIPNRQTRDWDCR